MAEPPKKIDILRRHMLLQNWREALKLAASFPRLGDEKVVITRAWEAMARPDNYRQMGMDPEKLVFDGIKALQSKYEPKQERANV